MSSVRRGTRQNQAAAGYVVHVDGHAQITLFGRRTANQASGQTAAQIGGYLEPSLSTPGLTRTSAA